VFKGPVQSGLLTIFGKTGPKWSQVVLGPVATGLLEKPRFTAFGRGNHASDMRAGFQYGPMAFYRSPGREDRITWPNNMNDSASHVTLEGIKHGLNI
jgi:hypothetical protein